MSNPSFIITVAGKVVVNWSIPIMCSIKNVYEQYIYDMRASIIIPNPTEVM